MKDNLNLTNEISWIEVQVIKVLLKKKRKATINGAENYKGKVIL